MKSIKDYELAKVTLEERIKRLEVQIKGLRDSNVNKVATQTITLFTLNQQLETDRNKLKQIVSAIDKIKYI